MLKFVSIFLIGPFCFASWAFMPKTFEAQVLQQQKSALSGKIKESRGQLAYRYPGHLRFEIKKPDEVIFVSNRTKTWYYTGPFMDGESGEVTISHEGDHILAKFFDSFSKGLESNSLYKVQKKAEKVEITFDEKLQKKLGVLSATFDFKTRDYKFDELKGLKIIQHDQQVLTLALDKIKSGHELSDNKFVFQVPENTKTIEQ